MSELITVRKSELLSLLKQAYEEGWAGYKELAEMEADHILEEHLKKNPGNANGGYNDGGPMPPPMSSYVMAGVPSSVGTGRDNPPLNLEINTPPWGSGYNGEDFRVDITVGDPSPPPPPSPGPGNWSSDGNLYTSNGNVYRSDSYPVSSSSASASSFSGILRTPTIQEHLSNRARVN